MNWKRSLKVLGVGIFLSLPWTSAFAQQVNMYWNTGGTGFSAWQPVSATNPLPVTASVSVGGFHPESSLTPITATTLGVSSSAFTAGKSVLVQNVGATNAAYCFPGAAATTSSEYVPAGGSALITTTAETVITCATSTSTTTINFQVGTGLWTGAGAGGGSGGGGGTSSAFDAAFPANGTAIGLSDGTNMKAWLTALIQAKTAVNGNNMGSVANWLYNAGATSFDAAPGDATNGAWVNVKTSVPPTPSSAAGIGIAPVVSASAEGTHVLKAGAGNLYGLTTTIGATTGWVMVFDATSAPADGAVTPKFCRYIKSDGTGGSNSLAWNPPAVMATGISVAFSSTGCFTKTASATAFFSGQVQ